MSVSAKIGKQISEERWYGWVVNFGFISTFMALIMYGYLGIFSRYGSDDYCLTGFYYQPGNLIDWMIQWYTMSSSRYTNILFIGLVDKIFGWYNVAILPGLMITLFVIGLAFLLKEIAQAVALDWDWRFSFLLAGLILYFSLLQAPNLYETLYWRAGMTSHFAPLVFMSYLGGFLLHQIRRAGEAVPPIWAHAFGFLFAFTLGGFSEPPVAVMITVLVLALFALIIWGKVRYRRGASTLLAWTLFGALLALATLALAPANSLRLKQAPPGLFDLITKTFIYPGDFILDAFKSFPTPTMVSAIIPMLLFYGLYAQSTETSSQRTWLRLLLLFVLILAIGYLLIAASFSPSVYGQSYPVARARILGRIILTCMFMASGAIFGVLLTGIKSSTKIPFIVSLIVLAVVFVYPLWTAKRVSVNIPKYQKYATLWDQRDQQIRVMRAQGQKDLIVPFLSEEPTQDLGDHRGFRLNICASRIYGVDSILAGIKH
jgi:hypothetical protein